MKTAVPAGKAAGDVHGQPHMPRRAPPVVLDDGCLATRSTYLTRVVDQEVGHPPHEHAIQGLQQERGGIRLVGGVVDDRKLTTCCKDRGLRLG